MPKILKQQKKQRSHRGGSPASDLVMKATTDEPLMNDYIPRTDSPMCGGSTASDMVSAQLNDNAKTVSYPEGSKAEGDINSLKLYSPSGGSRRKRNSKTAKGRKGRKGRKSHKTSKSNNKRNNNNRSRKSKKNNKKNNKKTNKRNNNRSNKIMKGGSDWISSQYSLGNINNQMNNTSDFSAAQGVDRNTLMNPPTMGLAGSGSPMGELEGANVRMVGAPLV